LFSFVCILFVCLLEELPKKTTPFIFPKVGGKVAHGPRKKPLNFDGNPDNVVALGYVSVGLGVTVGWSRRHTLHGKISVTRRLHSSNNVYDINGLDRGMRSTECRSSFRLFGHIDIGIVIYCRAQH